MSNDSFFTRNWKFIIPIILSAAILVLTVVNIFVIAPTGTKNLQNGLENKIQDLQNNVSQNIQGLQETQKSMLLKEYSDFEPDLGYFITPLKQQNDFGGYPYDMLVSNQGKYDQFVTNTWWVSRICDKNNTVQDMINPQKTNSSWVVKQGDDHPYFLQVYRIFPQLENVKTFELEVFVQTHPSLPTGTINEIYKSGTTHIQYDYDEKYKTWIPRFNNHILDCGLGPSFNTTLTISTTKQFQVIIN